MKPAKFGFAFFRLFALCAVPQALSRCLCAEQETLTAGGLLSEPAGARASAMGDAGVAFPGDLGAMNYNPASLASLSQNEFLTKFYTGVFDVNAGTLGYGHPTSRGGLGVTVAFLDAGEITIAPTAGSPETRRAQRDFAVALGGGLAVAKWLDVGLALKGIRSTLVEDFTAASGALDAGIMINTPVTGWRWGASLQNLGGKLKYKNAGDPIPTTVRAGTSFSFLPRPAPKSNVKNIADDWYDLRFTEQPTFTVAADGVWERNGPTTGSLGLDWTQWAAAAFRIGYKFGSDTEGFTAGFGVTQARKFKLDYSFGLLKELDNLHRVSVSFLW